MEKNKKAFILLLIAITAYVIGNVYFPLLIFLFIAPLIALKDINHSFKYKFCDFSVLSVLIVGHLAKAIIFEHAWDMSLIFSLLIWLAFIFYNISDTYLKNKIGAFTLIIFWLAVAYLSLNQYPQTATFLLGATFDHSTLITWSGYSGLLGVSCWILFGNVLLYIALFKGDHNILNGNIRWLSISYSLIVIALPLIIASFADFENASINSQAVINYFSGLAVDNEIYAQRGEVFGRTASWVSILLILYAFVKRRIK